MSPGLIGLIVLVCVFGRACGDGAAYRPPRAPFERCDQGCREARDRVNRNARCVGSRSAGCVFQRFFRRGERGVPTRRPGSSCSIARSRNTGRKPGRCAKGSRRLLPLESSSSSRRIPLAPWNRDRRRQPPRWKNCSREFGTLAPQNEAQRSLQARALDVAETVAQTRWLAIEAQEAVIPPAFLGILVFWLTAMFASFGLFAPRNAMTVAALCLGALSLAAAVFLIEEMNDPIGGVIAISSAPMYKALGFLGQ